MLTNSVRRENSRCAVWGPMALFAVAVVGCPRVSMNEPGGSDDDKTGTTQRVITTVVGNGTAGDNGDGLPGTETALYLVQDMTVGPDGLLYFPDWNNHKIRRLKADGTVETIAGTGELGAAPDGYAPEIQLNHPTNLEFDGNGDMLVAAWHNSLIKRVNIASAPYLQATTICGTGARSFNGDGLLGSVTFVDLPSSVVYDPGTGNVVFSDQANFRIRVLEASGVVHTICGDGTPAFLGEGVPASEARLSSPRGQSAPPAGRITRTARGEIIIADTGNHVIRKIDGAGMITTIAGTPNVAGYAGDGGPATAALLNTPSDVAAAPDGSIYVADTLNHVVRVLHPDGTIATAVGTGVRGFAGDGGAPEEAELDRPYGVTVGADGTLYVADTHNHRIRRVTAGLPAGYVPPTNEPAAVEIVPCTQVAGSICTYAGTGEKGKNGDGLDRLHTILYWPIDIEFLPNGRIIFLDWNNHTVREVLPDDTVRTIMGTDFVGDGPRDLSDLTPAGADPLTVDLNHPTDIQALPNGDILIVAWHNHKLRVIDALSGRVRVLTGAAAAFAGDGGPAFPARVNQPRGAVLTPDGDLFLVDQRNQRIRVFRQFAAQRENAIVATVVGTGAKGFNGDGHAGLQTQLSFQTGGNPEPSGGIAYDFVSGDVFISDSDNHRIRRVHFLNGDFTDSIVTTVAGNGVPGYSGDGGPAVASQIDNPQDLEIGPDGRLYFADTNNHVVRRIDLATGIITTVAGTGVKGYSGDGGPATQAELNRPFGVAFGTDGDLYISDTFNSRIRKVRMGN
jgi:sugar lactone lactonase YvrE